MEEQRPIINIDIHDNQKVEVNPSLTTMNVTNNYFGKGASAGVDPQVPLSYYITDADLRQQIIDTAEQRCTKADNVKKLIYDPLVEKGYSEGMLRSSEFLRVLIPHLTKMQGVDIAGLQRAFRENKK